MFLGETIKTGKVFGSPVDTTLGTVTVDASHLPFLQPQPEQVGAVGCIGIEGENFVYLFVYLII